MKTYQNEFTNGEITVTYEPRICTNALNCAKGLSEVFRTSVIPWINLDAAETSKIVSQINKCPSGALDYCLNNSEEAAE